MMVFPSLRHSYSFANAPHISEYHFWMMADYFSEHMIGDSQKHLIDIKQMNRW
jgi:hypothetical protein